MLPPRHGKSEEASVYTPAWFLERWPQLNAILCGHTAEFAAGWGRRVRNLFIENADILSTRLSEDSQAAHRWNTTQGGGMLTAGVGGAIVGRGGHLIVVDDPIKDPSEANSQSARDAAWDWWTHALQTRCEPGCVVVVIMHRWHEDDLLGRALRPEFNDPEAPPWEVIRLPAIAEADDPLGRPVGQALWRERYDEKALRIIRRKIGERAWVSLFQQRPPKFKGGEVYANFSEANVDESIEAQANYPIDLACDFNRNPGCYGIVGQHGYSPRPWATALHQIHDEGMSANALALAFIRWVKETGGWRFPHVEVYGDYSGNRRPDAEGPTAWIAIQQLLQREGWPVKLKLRPGGNPPVSARVDAVNGMLSDPDGLKLYKVKATACPHLVRDFQSMRWNGNELDKRDAMLSHPSDADGYRIEYLFGLDLKGAIEKMAAKPAPSRVVFARG